MIQTENKEFNKSDCSDLVFLAKGKSKPKGTEKKKPVMPKASKPKKK